MLGKPAVTETEEFNWIRDKTKQFSYSKRYIQMTIFNFGILYLND